MDLENPVIKLCVAGTQAEFRGALEEARALYQQAWDSARDDYEACIAAHYVARFQDDPEQRLQWNRIALERAEVIGDERVREFYPSLYLNMGQSYELLGDQDEAKHYFDLAAGLGVVHEAAPEQPPEREDGKDAMVTRG